MDDFINFDFSNPEYLKLVFESHCETLSLGLKISISDDLNGEHQLSNYSELEAKFPQLNKNFKEKMKIQYHLN